MKETVEEATNKFQDETERLLNELLPDQKKKIPTLVIWRMHKSKNVPLPEVHNNVT